MTGGGVGFSVPIGTADSSKHRPFAFLELMNRYASNEARLTIAGLGSGAEQAFASGTDLGTGLEFPLPLVRDEDGNVSVVYSACRPRMLLRIYWPLER